MAMMPPPSPGPSRAMGPPPSPSTHGLSAAARFHEPRSPAAGAGVPPSPMSRLQTPPRFALPSVEAGGSDRELVYTADPSSALRSPFAPNMSNMPEFGLSSDASPLPAQNLPSPMNPAAMLSSASGEDTRVMSGTPYSPAAAPRAACPPLGLRLLRNASADALLFSRTGIAGLAGFKMPSCGKSPTKTEAAIFYQALNSPQQPARILGPMSRNPSSPPRTDQQEREAAQEIVLAASASERADSDGESFVQSCVIHPARAQTDLLLSLLTSLHLAPARSQNSAIAVHFRAPARR